MLFRLQTGLGQLHSEINGNMSEHVHNHLACSLLKWLCSMADKTVKLLLRGRTDAEALSEDNRRNVQIQPILRAKAVASLSNRGHFMCNPT